MTSKSWRYRETHLKALHCIFVQLSGGFFIKVTTHTFNCNSSCSLANGSLTIINYLILLPCRYFDKNYLHFWFGMNVTTINLSPETKKIMY